MPISLPTEQLKRLVERGLPKPLLSATTKKFVLRLAPRKPPEERNWLQKTTAPLLEWVDKTIDASAQLAYTVTLADWTLYFEGQQANMVLLLDLNGQVELDQALHWQGAQHATRQKLACPAQIALELKGTVVLTEAATLNIQLEEQTGSKLTIKRLCSNAPLQRLDWPELLRPTLEPLQKDLVHAINAGLTQQLQHFLEGEQAQEQLSFRPYLQQAAEYLDQAYPLQDSIWLVPNAQRLVLSPPIGRGAGPDNHLQLAVGIEARPTVVLQQQPPKVRPLKSDQVALLPYQPKATLYLKGQWALEHAAAQVQTYLREYVQINYASYGYAVGAVNIYPQDSAAVVGVQLLRQATGKHKAWFYLKGVPQYDAARQEVYLSDLRFTARSKDLLIQLAKWLRQAELLRQLEQNTRWDAAPYFKQAEQQLQHWTVVQTEGTLAGTFDQLKIQRVWISEQYFEVALQARGTIQATINWEAW